MLDSLLPLLRALACAAAGLALSLPAGAQGAAAAHATQAQIDEAIDRGAAYLISRQELDGSWRANEYRYTSGQTGLSLYTLLKAGVPRTHPSIQRGIGFLKVHPPRWTYGIACCILALHEADQERHRAEIEEWLEVLLEAHGKGFNYPGGHEDLSLTQYGCLALRVAEKMGVEVNPKVWRSLLDFGLDRQHQSGAFNYIPGRPYTGSMTAAGIAVVQIASEALRDANKLSPRQERSAAAAIDQGVAWLGTHMVMDRNPDPDSENQSAGHMTTWHHYYLYGLERVGGLTARKLFGTRDWYREAADFLVKTQAGKGWWANVGGHMKYPNTCFAVLVLRRATSPTSGQRPPMNRSYGDEDPARPVSLRATGDTPLTVYVSQFGTESLETHEWDDERGKGLRVWRVEYFDVDSGKVLATVAGDSESPHRKERFAARVRMARPGTYKVAARVLVRPIDDLEDEEVPLVSQTLEVRINAIETPEQRRYQDEFGLNVLAGTSVKVTASSEHGGRAADRVLDGLTAHGWACAPDDEEPWINLKPRRPQRGTTVALTPLLRAIDEPMAWGRPTRVRLTVNGKDRGEHDVDLSGQAKAVIELGKRVTIRELRITVLGRQPGNAGAAGRVVGFGEIELQLKEPKKDASRKR